MAPVAIAEDTLGSIRIPAGMCGICGLRPTYGRYPDDGIMPLTTNKFDQVGPLARTVEDLALFDSAITGDMSPLAVIDLKGVRIGIADFFLAQRNHSLVELERLLVQLQLAFTDDDVTGCRYAIVEHDDDWALREEVKLHR